MATPALLPPGLIRSLALLAGALLAIAGAWPTVVPVAAASDLASVTLLVGGGGFLAWAAAHAAAANRMTPMQAFGTGLVLPAAILFLIPRTPRAANDNQPFSGSWPQFMRE